MAKPSLTYFSARGLIEPIRLLLEDGRINYVKKELGPIGPGIPLPDSLMELKHSGVLDFGSVPLWEEDGLQLVQSAAIARHIARKYGYAGENENEASTVDAVIEGVRDFIAILIRVSIVPDEQKEQAWNEVVNTDVPKWLGLFEGILKRKNSTCFVGNKVTVADFYVFSIVEELVAAGISQEGFPLIQSHFEAIRTRPNIASYLSSPTRYPPNMA